MPEDVSKKLEAINQVCEMIDEVYDRYAYSFGMTDTELNILYALSEGDGEYLQSDLCRQWHCSLQTIHTTVKNMEKKSLVELICQAGNKKNKYIHLTTKGRELVEKIAAPLMAAEEEAFSMLTAQEQDILPPLLQKYANALHETIGRISQEADI